MRSFVAFCGLALIGIALAVVARAAGPPSPAVLDQARLLVSAPIGNHFVADVWLSASSTGGECQFVTADRVRSPDRPRSMGAGGCSARPWSAGLVLSQSVPLNVGVVIATRRPRIPARDWVPPIVSGVAYPGLHAARIRIVWHGGSHALVLRNNEFVGGGAFLYQPPFKNLPYVVVAYDRSGSAVARKKLESPALYPDLNGWKAFTPAYLHWKKTHHR